MGGPAAARTWLKKSGLSIVLVSSRRFSSFHAGSVLWNRAGCELDSPVGYQPKPNPSPFTVSLPRGEFSDCATRECSVFRITSAGRNGSPE